jgi:hypothetical protein
MKRGVTGRDAPGCRREATMRFRRGEAPPCGRRRRITSDKGEDADQTFIISFDMT